MHTGAPTTILGVSRPPVARAKVLRAFVEILLSEGESATTMEAVAARAGVTKGGLLYHFGSRDALVQGLLERLDELGEADVAAMRSAAEGPVDYYLRTSDVTSSVEFNELFIAASRLTKEAGVQARTRLRALETRWLELLTEAIGDDARARLVLLLGDGLYLQGMIADAPGRPAGTGQLDLVLPLVQQLLATDR